VAKGSLDAILQGAGVWRGRDPVTAPAGARLPSGWPRLDAVLAGGGWPLGTLIELLLPAHGLGELRLLVPALQQLTRPLPGETSRWLVWVSPPHEPYPPALAQSGLQPTGVLRIEAPQSSDRLWAVEQVLRSGSAAAVLCWIDSADDRWLRRLKLAAEGQSVLLVALRPTRCRAMHSPAALRLELQATAHGLDIQVLKERGRAPTRVTAVFEA
jgi:hypothetical protein